MSPAPRFHAVRKWVRKELYETCTLFVQAYREAAELLRAENRNAPPEKGRSSFQAHFTGLALPSIPL